MSGNATAHVPDDRMAQCLADATEELQTACVNNTVLLEPGLAGDLVMFLARRELAVHQSLDKVRDLAAELTAGQVVVERQLKYAARAVTYATRAKRHWLAQFCPVCWLWTATLWCVGVRGPLEFEADALIAGADSDEA